MTKSIGLMAALSLLTAVALPFSASAQDPNKKPAAPARPAAPPAARPAPVARPAPAPAPVVRSAPVARPAPVVRAPTQASPQRANVPHVAPQRAAAPQHVAPRHETEPRRGPRDVAPTATSRIRNTATPNVSAAQTKSSTVPPAAQLRVQQRQERALRRAENRQLRNLPAAQRTMRRQEIQNARQLRAQQLQAQPNAQIQQNAQIRSSNLRRNGQARVTTQAARQGRFASAFVAAPSTSSARAGRIAAHRAWRRGLRASFVAWYGPVFWPYAYSDIFDFAFWPYGYDDGYWAYAYDDFFDGVFWGEYGPPEVYAYAAPSAPRATYAVVQELCKQPGSGVTAWPVAEIERKVGLNTEQMQLLDEVRKAGSDAAASFKASCPAENIFPMTPPGRLAAMTARLDATLQAVQTVKPALERFYDSLSDEQKERFNALGPKRPANNAETTAALPRDAKSCGEAKPGLTNLPIERIEDTVKPTDAQQADLKALEAATVKAVSIMQAACPEDTPITPPGRLQAMEQRLQAMIDAAKTVKPALENFYGSLSSEQKARFNRIGGQLAQTDG